MGESDKNTTKHHTQEPRGQRDYKAAMNRQDGNNKEKRETQISKRIHKRNTPLELVSGLWVYNLSNNSLISYKCKVYVNGAFTYQKQTGSSI